MEITVITKTSHICDFILMISTDRLDGLGPTGWSGMGLSLIGTGAENSFQRIVTAIQPMRLPPREQRSFQNLRFVAANNPTQPKPMKLNTILAADLNPFGTGALPEILKPFDVDGDGKLSQEERQAYLQAVRDGQVARPDRPERPDRPDRPDHPTGNPWDTDGDGVLSDAEKAAAQAAIRARILEQRTKHFDDLDKDDDGFLSLAELEAIPGIRAGNAARILAHLDKDPDGTGPEVADGKVSKEEFLNALRPPHPADGGPRPGGGGTPPGDVTPPAGR